MSVQWGAEPQCRERGNFFNSHGTWFCAATLVLLAIPWASLQCICYVFSLGEMVSYSLFVWPGLLHLLLWPGLLHLLLLLPSTPEAWPSPVIFPSGDHPYLRYDLSNRYQNKVHIEHNNQFFGILFETTTQNPGLSSTPSTPPPPDKRGNYWQLL